MHTGIYNFTYCNLLWDYDTKSFTPVHIVQLLDYMSTLWHMQNLEVPYHQSHLQAYNGL